LDGGVASVFAKVIGKNFLKFIYVQK